METPVFIPYTCIRCGLGNGQREWFIDIGIDNEMALDNRNHGAIYYCNECIYNFISDVRSLVSDYNEDKHQKELRDGSRPGSSPVDGEDNGSSKSNDSGSIVGDRSSEELDDTTESSDATSIAESESSADQPGDGNSLRDSGSLSF
jgi:hypothetical protein